MPVKIFKGLTVIFLVGAFLQLLFGPGHLAGAASMVLLTGVMVFFARKQATGAGLTAAIAATALALLQLGLVAAEQIPPLLASTAHLLASMLLAGSAIFLATAAFLPAELMAKAGLRTPAHKFYFRSIGLTGAGLLLLFAAGALVSQSGSGAACPDWPLCWGAIFPTHFSLPVAVLLLHRFTAVVIGVLVAGIVLQTRHSYQSHPGLRRWSNALGLLFMGQIAMGSLYSINSLPADALKNIHLLLTSLTWTSLVALGSICFLTVETMVPLADPILVEQPPQTVKQKALTYFKLTKPWVMILLLVTTITAMVIAARGLPPLALMLTTLLGGALSAGGASALNSYIDSDIDQKMSRTSRRATATGLVTPRQTLVFGLTLSALSFLILAAFVNTLSAVLSTIGLIYYVFFYTLYLKRNTIHNIVIGGAAGAIPPLVGWTAVTNSLDLGAFYLFAIIFFWTPPHTWALAMLVKKDYASARVPMLPVVVGEQATSTQIWLYSVLLIGLTLLPFTFHMAGWLYLATALLLGIRFLQLAWKLWHNATDKALSRKLYKYSQSYLALLFLMMAIDRVIL